MSSNKVAYVEEEVECLNQSCKWKWAMSGLNFRV